MALKLPTRSGGFTLLEMVVVLALVSMMSVIIIEALRFGSRAYAQTVAASDDQWQTFATHCFLRAILESIQPFKPERADGMAYGLEGTDRQLSVSASRSPLRGPGSLTRYDVYVSPDRDAPARFNLMMRQRVDRDGRPETELTPEDAEVLVENVSGVELRYFDAPCNAPATWREAWKQRRDLPALVRVRVFFHQGDARRWPDLVVAPRVTDDFIFSLYSDGTEQHACNKS